jgi:hypothetical protein
MHPTPDVALRLHKNTARERERAATEYRLTAPLRHARRARWKARVDKLATVLRRPILRPRARLAGGDEADGRRFR